MSIIVSSRKCALALPFSRRMGRMTLVVANDVRVAMLTVSGDAFPTVGALAYDAVIAATRVTVVVSVDHVLSEVAVSVIPLSSGSPVNGSKVVNPDIENTDCVA